MRNSSDKWARLLTSVLAVPGHGVQAYSESCASSALVSLSFSAEKSALQGNLGKRGSSSVRADGVGKEWFLVGILDLERLLHVAMQRRLVSDAYA